MKDNLMHGGACGFSGILTILQTESTLRAIQIVFTILAAIFTIIDIIYKWYRKAKHPDSDGGTKITKDEYKDLANQLKDKEDQ